MMQCCGLARDTKFCPDCGKLLEDTAPLSGLLAHCRNNERQQRVRLQRADNEYEVTKATRTHKKWKAWADQLEHLINQSKANE